MAREREDISGVNCLRDPGWKLIVDEVGIKEAWKHRMEKLMNEENIWDQEDVCERKEGPACTITKEEVKRSLRQMF